jgi:hypothetical protein
MGIKFSIIGRGQNLVPTTKEADQADYLFIGGKKIFIQWSVSQKKVIRDYGRIMESYIYSMVQTSDKKYLFLSDIGGF